MVLVDDIISSKDILSVPDASSKVVQIGGNLAVKFGGNTSLTEAANLEYLSRRTNIPVPEYYSSFSDLESDRHFIVMQYMEGITLEQALPTLDSQESVYIAKQIQGILQILRLLRSPGYLGSVNCLPYANGVFYDPETSPSISGPFSSEDEFFAAMLRRFDSSEPAS